MKVVNVIIPNYNNEQYIAQCVKSVINQNYPRIEIFIVDDGSTDASIQKVKEYECESIHIIEQCNMNASVARNLGLQQVKAGYVLFIDSDDYLNDNNTISNMVRKLERANADIAIGNYIDFSYEIRRKVTHYTNRIIEGENIVNLLADSPVPTNKLYKFEIIKDNSIWFDNLRIGQDVNFYLKYMAHCDRVCTMEENIYFHRVTKTNMSNSYNFNIMDVVNSFSYVEKYYSNIGLNAIYRDSIVNFAYKNLFWQMMKFIEFENIIDRKIILNYFVFNLTKYEEKYFISQKEKRIFNIIKICKLFICEDVICYMIKRVLLNYEKRKKNGCD